MPISKISSNKTKLFANNGEREQEKNWEIKKGILTCEIISEVELRLFLWLASDVRIQSGRQARGGGQDAARRHSNVFLHKSSSQREQQGENEAAENSLYTSTHKQQAYFH